LSIRALPKLLTIKKARIISARGSNTHALNQLDQLQQEAQSGRPGVHALLLDSKLGSRETRDAHALTFYKASKV